MQFFATMEKLVLRYYNFFLEGVRNTLIIAFFAVLLGTLLGTLMAMARMSRIKPLKWLATAYIEFFRNAFDGAAHVYLLWPAHDRRDIPQRQLYS